MKILFLFLSTAGFIFFSTSACNKKTGPVSQIKIDGSSTVYPIMEAMAEEFQKINPSVRISVGVSGTGGGMKRFTLGDLDISGASRPIKEIEQEKAKNNHIRFYEVPLAYDGLVLVTSLKNEMVSQLTTEELKKMWQSESPIKTWKDVRPEWPNEEIKFFGPGTDSGTFDYFSEAIVGKTGAIRKDYNASEDDNVLVQGVAGDRYSIGFFGYSYYQENKDKLKLLAVQHKTSGVLPSKETILDGTYSPLSRPLFIYVSALSYQRKEVQDFIAFVMAHSNEYLPEIGYLPLQDSIYKVIKNRLANQRTGALSVESPNKGKKLMEIYE